MHVGRLHVEVCPFRWAHETLPQAHGSQTVSVSRLWTQLFPLRPPGFAQETPPPGVRQCWMWLKGKRCSAGFIVSLVPLWLEFFLLFKELAFNIGLRWTGSGGHFPQSASFHLINVNDELMSSMWMSGALYDIIIEMLVLYQTSDQLWKVQTFLLLLLF